MTLPFQFGRALLASSRVIALAIGFNFAVSNAPAENPPFPIPPQLKRLPESFVNDVAQLSIVLESILKPYTQVPTLEYSVERNTPADPVYSRTLWRERGNQFYYEAVSISKPANFELQKSASFDGKRSHTFDPLNSILTIKNGLPDLSMVTALDSPFMPYEFLREAAGILRLSDLRPNSEKLMKLAARSQFVGQQRYQDRAYFVVRFNDCFDEALKEKVTMDVFFDEARGFFPMLWRSYDADGYMIKEYSVRTLKKLTTTDPGVTLQYPLEASLWQSKWPGTITTAAGPVKYLGSSRDITFQHVSINPGDSDELFTIDPIVADVIVDADAKTSVRVPK